MTDIKALFDDIIEHDHIVKGWHVEATQGSGTILASTRTVHDNEPAAISAAAVLVEALAAGAPGKVRATSRGAEPLDDGGWRGVVEIDVE